MHENPDIRLPILAISELSLLDENHRVRRHQMPPVVLTPRHRLTSYNYMTGTTVAWQRAPSSLTIRIAEKATIKRRRGSGG